MKIKVISTFLILLLVGCNQGEVNTALNVARTIASIGTFVIAVILFDRFGLKKKNKNEQVRLAVEFYKKLRNISIGAKTKDQLVDDLDLYADAHFAIRPTNDMYQWRKPYLNNKYIVYTSSYEKYFNEAIKTIVTDVLFPQVIYDRFKFIQHDISRVILTHEWDFDKFVYLKTNSTKFEKSLVTLPVGVQQIQFQHFINNLEKLVQVTEQYLKENGLDISNRK